MTNLVEDQALRLKRAHIALMRQPSTALYSGIILMGKNEVESGSFTARTDGLNKFYCAEFIATMSDPKLRGLVLHENLHVALNQIVRGKNMISENQKLFNIAADFVVNGIIASIRVKLLGKDEPFVELPDGALYDPMFNEWSVREVYDYLKKESDSSSGGSGNPQPQGDGSEPDGGNDGQIEVNGKTYDLSQRDEHDVTDAKEMDGETAKKHAEAVERALRQGGMFAGRLGANMPRAISDSLQAKVDWREVLRDFVSNHTSGKDEMTWRKYNRRLLASDMYLPSSISETVNEIIYCIDTSGSIDQEQLNEAAAELVSICEVCEPEVLRVIWWDTEVRGVQKFGPGEYANILRMLKPAGGGGTRVGCVSEYIEKEKLKPECMIIITDGYVESSPNWTTTVPALWLVTRLRSFVPPANGKKVLMERD